MEVDEYLEVMLEDMSFEDVLDQFDVTVFEAFNCLYDNGLIDEELLKELLRKES